MEQTHGQRGDFGRLDEPAARIHRRQRCDCLVVGLAGLRDDVARGAPHELGRGEPRAQRVHGHACAADFRRQRARQSDERVLRGRIRGDVWRAGETRHGRDVDHASPGPLEHARQHGANENERPCHVGAEMPLPHVEIGSAERRRLRDPGVVHEDVDRTQGGAHGRHGQRHGVGVAHVERDRHRSPSDGAQRAGHVLDVRARAGGNGDSQARLDQCPCDLATDAPPPSGDERHVPHGLSTQNRKKSGRVPSRTSHWGSVRQRTRGGLDPGSGSRLGPPEAQPTSNGTTSIIASQHVR